MLDFDKELSTFYQLLDEIETEERLLGDGDDSLSRCRAESGPSGHSSHSSGHSSGSSDLKQSIGSTSGSEPEANARSAEARIEGRISSLLSALAKQRRVVVATVAVVGIAIVGISHGGTLIKKSLGLASQSEMPTVGLTISTDPSGAKVFVDGELVGVSPFEGVQISSRSRVLGVAKSGFVRLDSLLDASKDIALDLPLELMESEVDEASVVRKASLTLAVPDSLQASLADTLMASAHDTLMASANDTLSSSVTPVALRLPTRPVEVVRPTLQPQSDMWSVRGGTSINEKRIRSDSSIDEFSRLRLLGDERYGAGLYSEAVAIYAEALQLRPGNTAVVNSIRMARAAAAIDELPSTVFSPEEAAD